MRRLKTMFISFVNSVCSVCFVASSARPRAKSTGFAGMLPIGKSCEMLSQVMPEKTVVMCTATFKLKMFLVSCSINISRFFIPNLKTQAVPGGVKPAMSACFNMGAEAKITIFPVRQLTRKISRNQYCHLQALINEQSICSPLTLVSITCGENSGGTWGVEKNDFILSQLIARSNRELCRKE